jgi:hypothetical protein
MVMKRRQQPTGLLFLTGRKQIGRDPGSTGFNFAPSLLRSHDSTMVIILVALGLTIHISSTEPG